MINELSEEQIELMNIVKDKWISKSLHNKEPINKEKAEKGIEFIYGLLSLKKPKIIYVNSPLACQYAATLLKVGNQVMNQVGTQAWNQVWNQVENQVGNQVMNQVGNQVMNQVWNQAWNQVWNQVGTQVRNQVGTQVINQVEKHVGNQVRGRVRNQVLNKVEKQVEKQVLNKVWAKVWTKVGEQVLNKVGGQVKNQVKNEMFPFSWDTILSVGWVSFYDYFTKIGILNDPKFNQYLEYLESNIHYALLFKNYAIVCGSHSEIRLNKEGQLHSESEAAIEWEDGYKLYFLNGISMKSEYVLTPAKKLDPKIVLQETNADVRRELVRKIGAETLVHKLGGTIIDKMDDYELIVLNIPDMEIPAKYLKMKNPSIKVFHVEGVPPEITTCKQALAWRNGEQNYTKPEILT